MNKVVDFSIAKLLKEKGFDEQNLTIYQDGEVLLLRSTISNSQFMTSRNYTAPTIAEVIDWLYEKYSIWIYLIPAEDNKNVFKPFFRGKNIIDQHLTEFYNSPTEAYEKGIEYCLTNLI